MKALLEETPTVDVAFKVPSPGDENQSAESPHVQPPFDLQATVCRHWFPNPPEGIQPIDHAGWSGAAVSIVTAGGRGFVLKRCGEGMSRQQAEWMHAAMAHCRSQGLTIVPEVIEGRDGSTLCADATGSLWELLAHLPGAAVTIPTTAQREAAADALATIHLALATRPGHPPHRAESVGVGRRRAQAAALLRRPGHAWAMTRAAGGLRDRVLRAGAIMATADARQALDRIAGFDPGPVTVQPVLRDVWSDHLLFAGSRVTGVIDWHAMGIDSPATDIARLTGSWPDSREHRAAFLDRTARLRPLEAEERSLVVFLDAAGVVCALDNWLRWLVEERRSFADMDRVLDHIDRLVARLPDALGEIVRLP